MITPRREVGAIPEWRDGSARTADAAPVGGESAYQGDPANQRGPGRRPRLKQTIGRGQVGALPAQDADQGSRRDNPGKALPSPNPYSRREVETADRSIRPVSQQIFNQYENK